MVDWSYISPTAFPEVLTMRLVTLRHVGISVALLSLIAACAGGETRADSAVSAGAATPPSNWAADSTAILAAVASLEDGWNRGDAAAHLGVYLDSATFIVPADSGKPPAVFGSVAAVRPTYVELLKGNHGTVRSQTLVLKPIGPDAAVHAAVFTVTQTGRPPASMNTVAVWARTPAGWRMAFDHSLPSN